MSVIEGESREEMPNGLAASFLPLLSGFQFRLFFRSHHKEDCLLSVAKIIVKTQASVLQHGDQKAGT
jgi:hypothetical protein